MSEIMFVGVHSADSAVRRTFPEWMPVLGLDWELHPVDLPLGSGAAAYRELVRSMRAPEIKGAIVTGHKSAIYRHARELFDDVDEVVDVAREIGTIRHDGALTALAVEPLVFGRALDEIVPGDHFRRSGGDLVLLGAGGSASSLLLALAAYRTADLPAKIFICDPKVEARRTCAGIARKHLPHVETHEFPSGGGLPEVHPGTVLVNASGLGKDRPGSPVPEEFRWPRRAVAWDLNYRGERRFLQQAVEASAEHVHDGWRLFVRAWTEALRTLSPLPLTESQIAEIALIAENLRAGDQPARRR